MKKTISRARVMPIKPSQTIFTIKYFKNQYNECMPELPNRKSIRLPQYDYTQRGIYFITICSWQRDHLFGTIQNSNIQLSKIGSIIHDEISKLPGRFPGVDILTSCILPNHIHMIIDLLGSMKIDASEVFQKPVRGSIPTIVRTLKSRVSLRVKTNLGREIVIWQRNYYEHIIRDQPELESVFVYVEQNVAKWESDKEFLKKIP